MRLLVTGGGTGGHVYPALSVVEAVLDDARCATTRADVAWVGRADSVEERIVAREGLAFYGVDAGALHGANPLAVPGSLWRLWRGYGQARRLLADFGPDVVLSTGGYVSAPVTLAAARGKCPVLIYLPDMEPGLAIKWLARFARRVAVSFPAVAAYFRPGQALVSGYPVRRALYTTPRGQARAALGLNAELPTLLVLGGSQGAHSINEAIRAHLGEILGLAQLVHICGPRDDDALQAVRAALPARLRERYHLHAYLYEGMTDALVAADLAVARAGASTLGEFPAAGLPAVVVPYPYAGPNQQVNAAYLAERGAGMAMADEALATELWPTLRQLLTTPERLAEMRAALAELAHPEAAATIADELLALSRGATHE